MVAALLAAPQTAPTNQRPAFKAGIDRVRVDALVTDGEHAVTGLSAKDFLIWDNGVAQSPELLESGGPVKVLLVLDISTSVAGERLEHLRAASSRLLDALNDDDMVGLLTFSERIDQLVPLTQKRDDVRQALATVHAGGRTALYDAVFTGLTLGAGETGRWLVLVFSDGADTASWLAGDRVLAEAGRSSLVVYGVTAEGRARDARAWLDGITAATGGRVTDAAGSADIGRVFVDLLNEYRSRYVLTFTPSGVQSGQGWHTLKVRTQGSAAAAKVVARKGYFSTR
jgi:Ca-activated chloride channel family protein